jgi:hypothetical protein
MEALEEARAVGDILQGDVDVQAVRSRHRGAVVGAVQSRAGRRPADAGDAAERGQHGQQGRPEAAKLVQSRDDIAGHALRIVIEHHKSRRASRENDVVCRSGDAARGRAAVEFPLGGDLNRVRQARPQ